MIETTGWGAVVATLILLATLATGWSGVRLIAVVQSLTPYFLLLTVPTAVLAVLSAHGWLAAAAWLATAALLVIVVPVGWGGPTRPAGTDAVVLTVAHDNMLFKNVRRAADAASAMLATGADVLAMSEFTPHHERALIALGGHERYPHRVNRPATHPGGLAVWSRFPISDVWVGPLDRRDGLRLTVDVDGTEVRLVLAHPDPPNFGFGLRHWEPSLRAIHRLASSPGPPTLIVGDLNSCYWHPPFRRLLRAGWTDAHRHLGRGLSMSWPTKVPFPFAFVRLDHALIGPGLTATAIDDIDVPGSDHRGFVVTVAATATNAVRRQAP